MSLRITNSEIRSDQTAHFATGLDEIWRLSWLPCRSVNRNQATTGMVLAETIAVHQVAGDSHRLWPHIQAWAAELDLSGHQALALPEPPTHTPGQTGDDR